MKFAEKNSVRLCEILGETLCYLFCCSIANRGDLVEILSEKISALIPLFISSFIL